MPTRHISAVGEEPLHPVSGGIGNAKVGDINVVARINRESLRKIQLPRPIPDAAPLDDEVAIGIELLDPIIVGINK
jgi:hypothetical protein